MSAVTRKRVIPAHEVEEELCHTCDFPGCEQKTSDQGMFVIDEVEIEVTVRHKEGMRFPEGVSYEEISVDVCPDCFKTKLIPWLESQGVKITRKDVNL